MDVRQVLAERRSIRKFKPDPVPESLIREILDEARWSPSWGNTQPWEFYVVTGEPLEKFKKANLKSLDEGAASVPDIKMPDNWIEPLKKRYSGVGKSTLEALEIRRDDAQARAEYARFMYRLFEAPCLIVGCIDKRSASTEYAMFDLGLISQSICLLAHNRGMGTCLMACAVRHPEALREILPNAENKLLAVGIALGYPDTEAAINRFKRARAPLDEIVTWVK
jgi:nitroreductase